MSVEAKEVDKMGTSAGDAAVREFAWAMDAIATAGARLTETVVRAERTERRLVEAAAAGPEAYGRLVEKLYAELTTPTEADVVRLAGLIAERARSSRADVAVALRARLDGKSWEESILGVRFVYDKETARRWGLKAVAIEPRFRAAFGFGEDVSDSGVDDVKGGL